MRLLSWAYDEWDTAYRFLIKRRDRRVFVKRDIAQQIVDLKDYPGNIIDSDVMGDIRSGIFALFVFYEPNGALSGSASRVLRTLKSHGIHTVLLCNHAPSEIQKAFFTETCHAVIRRGNQGFDFGAYKDGVSFLQTSGYEPSRLLILNDSVFYRAEGLDDFIKGLCGEEDAVAAFENWGEGYHLQSFALGVSGDVFRSEAFSAFWDGYVPVNNRIHAILSGEKKLSDALLSVARSSRVLYPVSELHEALRRDNNYRDVEAIHLPLRWRDELELKLEAQRSSALARDIADLVYLTSPIHAGAYLFPRYLGCPILKKDIVYRKRFRFWELEEWSQAILTADERTEFLTAIRRRCDPNRLSPLDQRRYNVGIK